RRSRNSPGSLFKNAADSLRCVPTSAAIPETSRPSKSSATCFTKRRANTATRCIELHVPDRGQHEKRQGHSRTPRRGDGSEKGRLRPVFMESRLRDEGRQLLPGAPGDEGEQDHERRG